MDDRTTTKGRRGPRRPTNVTLEADLLADAKQLDIDICEVSEAGLAEHVSAAGVSVGWSRTGEQLRITTLALNGTA